MPRQAKGGVSQALGELRRAERALEQQLGSVREVIRSLQAAGGKAVVTKSGAPRKRRQLSAAGREAIARAARRRWAEYRAKNG